MPDVYEEAVTVVRILSAMDCRVVTLADSILSVENRSKRAGRIRIEDGLDEPGWGSYVENLNAFAKMAYEDLGLRSAYHPHVGGLIETAQEVDRLMSETDADLVGLCLDTAHCIYGGDDPIDLLKRWAGRLRHLHIKECDNKVLRKVLSREGDYFDGVNSGVFPELGQGSVDFETFRNLIEEIGYDGWGVVEQDILPDTDAEPLASAGRNREFLKRLGW